MLVAGGCDMAEELAGGRIDDREVRVPGRLDPLAIDQQGPASTTCGPNLRHQSTYPRTCNERSKAPRKPSISWSPIAVLSRNSPVKVW